MAIKPKSQAQAKWREGARERAEALAAAREATRVIDAIKRQTLAEWLRTHDGPPDFADAKDDAEYRALFNFVGRIAAAMYTKSEVILDAIDPVRASLRDPVRSSLRDS